MDLGVPWRKEASLGALMPPPHMPPTPTPPISQHQSAMSVNSGSETSCPSESPGNVLGYRLLALMPRASDLVNMEVFSR